jgi:G:T-mismatch repair DNA endonuclease (very short patch repair protein)/ribosomal protein L40E
MLEEKICPVCGVSFNKKATYCSRQCFFKTLKGKKKSLQMRERLSKAKKGKPKPHMLGDKNPNYGGKYSRDPVVYAKILKANKKRGQAWGDEQKKAHSIRMLGSSNAMRGKTHTEECKKRISKVCKNRYVTGIAKISYNKISKPEKEIAKKLTELNVDFEKQFHIKGIPYWYDFYLPKHNLIIEFQGDYWHANPLKYKSGTILKIRGRLKLVDDIWERDKIKKEASENAGYKFLAIWESDYKKSGIEILKDYYDK